jgi:hypothetical protein
MKLFGGERPTRDSSMISSLSVWLDMYAGTIVRLRPSP